MIAALAAALLVAAPAPSELDQRLREAAAAAQALQGPLDGRWTLRDARGRPLYVFQFADPAQGAGPPGGAWSDPATGALGPLRTVARAGGRLEIIFDAATGPVRLDLRRRGGAWRGVIGGGRPVRLAR